MTELVTQEKINSVLWQAADTFRGKIDSSTYKDYILTMFFVKYISDSYKEKVEEYSKRYNGNEERIKRALSRERFVLDEESTFDYLYSKRNNPEIGEIINKALEKIENENAGKFVVYSATLTLTVKLFLVKQKNGMQCFVHY